MKYDADEEERSFSHTAPALALALASRDHPYTSCPMVGRSTEVQYEPGEGTTTGMFGGDSNWRGPVWFPINYLLRRICAPARITDIYGNDLKVECPTGRER